MGWMNDHERILLLRQIADLSKTNTPPATLSKPDNTTLQILRTLTVGGEFLKLANQTLAAIRQTSSAVEESLTL